MQYTRIVLNEPHASIEGLYDEHLSFWNIDERFVNDIVLKWTDWHTDYLFHGYRKENIRTVRFPYSRFIVDAERLWNDPLEAEGFNGPIGDIDYFLQLRDEALRIERLIYNKEYKRFVKYVKGGNTFFYTPMKKKERRKALRKSKQIPIEHFVQLYEDD